MFNKNWNTNDINYWKVPLEFNNGGFSNFQFGLLSKAKCLFIANSVKFVEKISEHQDLQDDNKIVKMVIQSLIDYENSKLWFYHDMAEYDLIKIHHIFEEWGYLKPLELEEKYLNNVIEILNLEKHST